jgi:hypothetical protein
MAFEKATCRPFAVETAGRPGKPVRDRPKDDVANGIIPPAKTYRDD